LGVAAARGLRFAGAVGWAVGSHLPPSLVDVQLDRCLALYREHYSG
jgi:hypothetical protein